VYHKIS